MTQTEDEQQVEWPSRVRRLRKRLGGLTQAGLADLLHLSLSCVQKWEEGLHVPQRWLRPAIEALEEKASQRIAKRRLEKQREREKREGGGSHAA